VGTNDDTRLIELESRSMHQEHLLDQLNAALIEQRTLLERLQRELARLKDQVLSGPPGESAHDEKPPHY
jgi:uncharacterized coiled-coil protein SlyX